AVLAGLVLLAIRLCFLLRSRGFLPHATNRDQIAFRDRIARDRDQERRGVGRRVDGDRFAEVVEEILGRHLVAVQNELRAWLDATIAAAIDDEEVTLAESDAAT